MIRSVLVDIFLSLSVSSSGLCPDWDSWDQTKPVDNAREAMQQADEWLGVPQVSKGLINPDQV